MKKWIFLLLFATATAGEFAVPLGLPPIPWPKDNPYTPEKAELGRMLYFDPRLSSDNTVSCASCHGIPKAFTDQKRVSSGIEGHEGTRNAPTVINTAYQTHLFWDGRAQSLEEQSKGPIANTKEMTNIGNAEEAHQQCQEKIRKVPGYRALFKKAFGHEECTLDDIAKAIATFERTVVSGNSPYDRYIAGDKTAMTPEQIKGWQVFQDVKCNICHAGFNFTDGQFVNIGVGMDAKDPDLGRYAITKAKSMWGSFKVPTLREVAHTYPYMHDGSLKTLDDVIDYYDKGGIPNQNLHPLMVPLQLTAEEKKALVAFMEALSGEGWQHFKAPEKFPE